MKVVLPAPTSPLTTTTSPGARIAASSAPAASVSAAELATSSAKEVELVGGGLGCRLGTLLHGLLHRLFSGNRRAHGEQVGEGREVLAQRLLHRRRPQRGGGVKERQEKDGATAELVHLRRAPDLGDPSLIAAEQLGGEVAERADDRRLDQPHLFEEVGTTGLDLQRLRVAVAGRPALQHVGDEDLLAREADLFQHLVEQLAGAADEGHALPVLFGPR